MLVCPASAACAKRSFSGLRRLKTWLSSSISQKQLTHLANLHANQLYFDEHAAEVLRAVSQEFISKTEERESTFGLPGQERIQGEMAELRLPPPNCFLHFVTVVTRCVKLYKYNWFTLVLLYRLWASRTDLRLHQIRG